MFRVPDAVVVRRPISLQGQVVPAGTTLSKAQVQALGRNLNALLDSGYVTATPDPYARKGKARPTPTSLPPVIRNALVGKLTGSAPLSLDVKAVGDSVSVSVSGGVPPFTVSLDGGEPLVKSSRTFGFSGVESGVHTVLAADGAGAQAEAHVEVAAPEEKKPARKKTGE